MDDLNLPETHPVCTIIAGPNGAGKTTFALSYLSQSAPSRNFVNADLIAAGLSPLAPEKESLAASRIFLNEIHDYVNHRESFAFETTLSGKSYISMIRKMLADGWQVNLFYLWLPNVEASLNRVAERVRHGGHNIPRDAIIRRYPRSIANLLDSYSRLCTYTLCLENSESPPQRIFQQDSKGWHVFDSELYEQLCAVKDNSHDT